MTLPGCDLSSPWMATKNWKEAKSKGQVGAMPRNKHGGKKRRVGDEKGKGRTKMEREGKRLNIIRSHSKNNKFQIQGRKLGINSW